MRIIDPKMLVLLNIGEADMDKKISKAAINKYLKDQSEKDAAEQDNYFVQCFKEMNSSAEKILKSIDGRSEQLHTLLMMMLGGEAKEMVRNAAGDGIEGWRLLHYRWNRKTQFGATQIAEMIGKIIPAKTPDEVYAKINQLDRLHLELQKNLGEDEVDGVKTKVVYGEAFRKADLLRVTSLRKKDESWKR